MHVSFPATQKVTSFFSIKGWKMSSSNHSRSKSPSKSSPKSPSKSLTKSSKVRSSPTSDEKKSSKDKPTEAAAADAAALVKSPTKKTKTKVSSSEGGSSEGDAKKADDKKKAKTKSSKGEDLDASAQDMQASSRNLESKRSGEGTDDKKKRSSSTKRSSTTGASSSSSSSSKRTTFESPSPRTRKGEEGDTSESTDPAERPSRKGSRPAKEEASSSSRGRSKNPKPGKGKGDSDDKPRSELDLAKELNEKAIEIEHLRAELATLKGKNFVPNGPKSILKEDASQQERAIFEKEATIAGQRDIIDQLRKDLNAVENGTATKKYKTKLAAVEVENSTLKEALATERRETRVKMKQKDEIIAALRREVMKLGGNPDGAISSSHLRSDPPEESSSHSLDLYVIKEEAETPSAEKGGSTPAEDPSSKSKMGKLFGSLGKSRTTKEKEPKKPKKPVVELKHKKKKSTRTESSPPVL